MSEWQDQKLGEVITLQRGFDITKKEQIDGPYQVISSSGFNSTHTEYKVKGPGVVIGRKGSLGTVHFTEQNFWPHDTTLWVKDFKDNYPLYVYYFLKTLRLENYDVGASNPTLNRNHVHKLDVSIPGVKTQQEIASILSAFDNLIENNTRRIAILEEMARLIYREWFVYYQYPGHENDRLVDSGTELGEVPEGWGVRKLLEICELQTGKALKSKQFNEDGIGTKAVRIRDVRTNSSQTYTDEDFEEKYFVNDGDILVGMDGDFHMCRWADGKSVLVQRVARFRPIEEINLSRFFLFWAIQKPIDFFNRTITGTTVAHLGKKHIETIEVVLPPKEMWNEINQLLDPLYEQELILRKKNKKLKEARDLLLPQLISGKIKAKRNE